MDTHSLVVSYALLAPAHVAVPFGNGSAAVFPTLNVGTPVLGSESGGLVEDASSPDACENTPSSTTTLEVEVRVEGGAETMQEADGPELGIPGRAGACAAQRRPDSPLARRTIMRTIVLVP